MTSGTPHRTSSPHRASGKVALAAALTALLTAGGLTAAHAAPDRAAAPAVDRVSVAQGGAEANGGSSHARLSRDGAFTIFSSAATNLTQEPAPRPPGPLHVRDNTTGEVTRIKDSLQDPSISDDGRYATFLAWGSHTVKVKLLDLATGQGKMLTTGSSKAASSGAEMSADGRYIAFTQVAEHPSIPDRVEVYDRVNGTYEVVSAGPPDASRDMRDPSISADGRYVAYRDAGTGDIWRADRETDTRTRVDDGGSREFVQLSGNGHAIAVNTADGAYVRDITTGATTRLPGKRADALSPNGHQLLYQSDDPVAYSALRLRHLPSGRDTLVHANARGVPGAFADEERLVFDSPDAGIVPGDTNGTADIFLRSAS
ncbi:protein TolB [Streptomyces sp. PmtG]